LPEGSGLKGARSGAHRPCAHLSAAGARNGPVGCPARERGDNGTAPNSSCPADPLPLQADSLGPSSQAALAAEPAKGEPRDVAAIWASRDRAGRGEIARNWCGKRTWRRTVVVTIDRRAYHPSASASLGVYFVSRFANGYRVWGQPH
jgi:hypothetical protein